MKEIVNDKTESINTDNKDITTNRILLNIKVDNKKLIFRK